MSLSSVPADTDWPPVYLSSLEIDPLRLIHGAWSQRGSWNGTSLVPTPKLCICCHFLPPEARGSCSCSGLNSSVTFSEWPLDHITKNSTPIILYPSSYAYSLHRTCQLCVFSTCLPPSLPQTEAAQQGLAFSLAAASTELRVVPGT